MKQYQEEKEMEGCTFAPERVTKKKERGEKRDINKFLEDQKRFQEQRQLKANERKERAIQEEQSKMNAFPVMSEKSKKYLELKKKKSQDLPNPDEE